MMKRYLLLPFFVATMLFSANIFAQSLADDLDDFGPGDDPTGIGQWGVWGTGVPSGTVSQAVPAYSGSNSLLLVGDAGIDAVYYFGENTGTNWSGISSGQWKISFRYYIPAGKNGYFNVQHADPANGPGPDWANEVYFFNDGTGGITFNGPTNLDAAFNYPQDKWFDVDQFVDLDNDIMDLYVNGIFVYRWTVSETVDPAIGLVELNSLNFYPPDADSEWYLDDIALVDLSCSRPSAFVCENMEPYIAGQGVDAQSALISVWPGGNSSIVSSAQAYSGGNSLLIDGAAGGEDCVVSLGDKTVGTWKSSFFMYVPTGKNGYFNVQHLDPVGGAFEWAEEAFFNDGGVGELDADGLQDIPFSFPHDEWFEVIQQYDLDNDITTLYVNAVPVHTWQFSLQSDGTAGLNQLAAFNFYPSDATFEFYLDDILLSEFDRCEEMNLLHCDFIDTYLADSTVGTQDPNWTTYDDAPGSALDATVFNGLSWSGDQSVVIADFLGTDAYYDIDDQASGEYKVSFRLYVPDGQSAYYGLYTGDPYAGGALTEEILVNLDSTVSNFGQDFSIDITTDSWIYFEQIINLDTDTANLYVNGQWAYGWAFGTSLGGINFWPASADDFYLVDDIKVQSLIPPTYDATFHVNMKDQTVPGDGVHLAGDFNGWTGQPMNDMGDGIWSLTVSGVSAGNHEFKYQNGLDNWENINDPNGNCTIGGTSNRGFTITNENVSMDTICYEACEQCNVLVTIIVDMAEFLDNGGTVGANGVHISGSFNGWSIDANPLTDANGDNVWDGVISVPSFSYTQYKFYASDVAGTDETVPMDCGVDNGLGGYNRYGDVLNTDILADTICFSSCVACVITNTNDPAFASEINVYPNPASDMLFVDYNIEGSKNLEIQVINSMGQIMMTTTSNTSQVGTTELNINNLANGLYIVKITDGETYASYRIAIEH